MEPRPWGFWGTLGLGLLVAAAFVGASQLAFVLFLVLAPAWGIEVSPETWRTNGLLWTLSVAFSAPAMLGFTWLFARLRRGIRVGEYLALKRAQTRDVALFCTLLLGWLVLSDHLAVLCRQPVVPEVMLEVYRTAYFPPLLWLALIVGAPISEEIFFRGFLFKGILHSRLRDSAYLVALVGGSFAVRRLWCRHYFRHRPAVWLRAAEDGFDPAGDPDARTDECAGYFASDGDGLMRGHYRFQICGEFHRWAAFDAERKLWPGEKPAVIMLQIAGGRFANRSFQLTVPAARKANETKYEEERRI